MSDVHMQDSREPHPREGASANRSNQTGKDMSCAPTIDPGESMSDNTGNNNAKTTQIHFAPPPFRGNAPLFASGYPSIESPQDSKPPGSGQLRSVVTSSFSVEDSSLTQHDRYHTTMQMDRGHNELAARPGPWPFPEREHHQNYPLLDYGSPQSPATLESPLGRPFEPVRRSFSSSSSDPPPIRRSFSLGSGDPIRRSFSSSSSELGPPTQPIKRTFYHHARTGEPYSAASLPPDFVPPKRTKVGPPRKPDPVISPKNQMPLSPGGGGGWYQEAPSWNSPSARPMESNTTFNFHHQAIPRTMSLPPPPNWANSSNGHHLQSTQLAVTGVNHVSTSCSLSVQVSPGHDDTSPRGMLWQHSPSMRWSSPPAASAHGRFWESSADNNQKRDDVESARNVDESRDNLNPEPYHGERTVESFASRQGIFRNPPPQSITTVYASESQDKMKLVAQAASFAESVQGRELTGSFMEVEREPCSEHEEEKKEEDPIVLLSTPEDKIALSETLCVVRENIEVFCANQRDVDAPAPGRKHPIVVGQVGLRCVHCRNASKASDRVKRAVCYPSSIKRIYRTVIDMKLDHFTQCKFVPPELTARLKELKAVHTRSTGTTMQYFIRAAHGLGMQDSGHGVRLNRALMPAPVPCAPRSATISAPRSVTVPRSAPRPETKATIFTDLTIPAASSRSVESSQRPPAVPRSGSLSGDSSCLSFVDVGGEACNRNDSMSSSESFDTIGTAGTHDPASTGPYYEGIIPLALKEDKTALSPLRCFLREQVCAFSATDEDIAVRAPTTFSIAVGQVGIGCVHCVKQAPMDRSNRAVCFPFSIGRIYQSVADIQRFHLGECKMLPPMIKEKFLSLQSASSKGSKGLATRQYWVASAKKIGLVDTLRGIRFGRDPTTPAISKAFSLDILAQAAVSVTTTSKKLVLPEDKKMIADFLYVVMEQLQPCRFTEADRNKRRVKDVGCIGVECKHCAGQVDSRKFFWSSVSAVESNFVSVHTHMLECRLIPESLKKQLIELKKLRKEQTAKLMTGSQKAFFRRVWARLHSDEANKQDTPEEAPSGTSDQQRSSVSTPRHRSPAGTPRHRSPASTPKQQSPVSTPPQLKSPPSQPLLLESPSALAPGSSSATMPDLNVGESFKLEGIQAQFFDTRDEQITSMHAV